MIRARAIFASSIVVITLVSSAGLAIADEPATKPDQRARAQELFDSALSDAEAGNFAGACPKFLASQDADPKTSTLLNLGNCYEKNNQSASAWGAFREAETAARKIGRTDWESSARVRAEALEPKLLRLAVVVPEASRAPGLIVVRDGSKISSGEWGVGIPVDPGVHVITASADGRESFATQVDIANASATVTVPVLTPVTAAPPPVDGPLVKVPPPDNRPSGGWSTMKTAGAITAGGGAAAVITSGVLALLANSRYDSAQAGCATPPHGCSAGAISDADSAYGLAAGATVVFVIGAAALAAGGALFFFAPEEKSGPRVAAGPGGIVGRW